MIDKLQQLLDDLKEYVNLRVETAKLQTVEGVAAICGRLLSLILIIMIGAVALMMFVAGLVVLLSMLIDSLFWAFMIMGGVLLVAMLVIYACRDKMFVNSFVKSLCSVVFKK